MTLADSPELGHGEVADVAFARGLTDVARVFGDDPRKFVEALDRYHERHALDLLLDVYDRVAGANRAAALT